MLTPAFVFVFVFILCSSCWAFPPRDESDKSSPRAKGRRRGTGPKTGDLARSWGEVVRVAIKT